jgi:hypothetical protein
MSKQSLSIINLRKDVEIAISAQQVFLNINPSFQRQYESWDNKLKTRLIETMLIGRAMNPIWTVYNDEEDSEEVLDGMHRLMTALSFLNNEFSIGKELMELDVDDFNGKYFNDLTPDQKQNIRNYEFTFNKLDSTYKNDREKLSDMYELLNRSSKPLNEFEFQKPVLQAFYKILEQHKALFFNSPLYPYEDSKRGKIEEEMGKWLAFSDKKLLKFSSTNDMYKKWKVEIFGGDQGKITNESVALALTQHSNELSERLSRIKYVMDKLKDMKLFSISWKRKYRTEYMMMVMRTVAILSSNEIFIRLAPQLVERFSKHIIEEDQNNEMTNGRNCSFQIKLINTIDAILYDVFEKNNDRRFFPKEMIDEKLKEQEGMCPLCKETITEHQKYEADHIVPWTNGGKTEKENLQVLHQRCHKLKFS